MQQVMKSCKLLRYILEMQTWMRFVRKNLFEILKGKEKNILLCTVSTVLTARLTVIDVSTYILFLSFDSFVK